MSLGPLLLSLLLAAASFPPLPTQAPIVSRMLAPCKSGPVERVVYDIDPGGPNAQVRYTRPNETIPLLVLVGTPSNARVYIRLPGRGVEEWTWERLNATYNTICDIADHIEASPR